MKIYAPTLECMHDPFPSKPRKHCQKPQSQKILCSLKLPSGPPQISLPCQPCRPALCIFELNLSLGNFTLSRTEGLFNVILWIQPWVIWDWEEQQKDERQRGQKQGKGGEARNTKDWRGAKTIPEREEINDRWMEREKMSGLWIRSFKMSAKCSIIKLEQLRQLGFRFRPL